MSKDIKGYVYRIKPTISQIELVNKTFGCVRKMWNTLLFERETIYEMFGKYPELHNAHVYANPKYIKGIYPYMYEVDSQALTTAWLHLKNAYQNFFNQSHDHPLYKSRNNPIQSYTTHIVNDNIRIERSYLKLPKLGLVKIKLHRPLPKDALIKAVTVKKEAGKYYVSLRVTYEHEKKQTEVFQRAIGLDYTLHGLYVDSEGNRANCPNYYKQSLIKLAHEQKILSRRQKKSSNYESQKLKIQKLHQHIKNQRQDFLHKASRYLVNTYDVISIETLDLKEMAKTKHFRKSISDTSYNTFARYLEYKTKGEGKTLVKIDKYYASTKTCSRCGKLHDMPLAQRVYTCACGNQMDRDLNAAINIGVQGLIEHYQKAYGTDAIAWSSSGH